MEFPNGSSALGSKRKFAAEPVSPRGQLASCTGAEYPSYCSYKCKCSPTAPALVESCFNYLNSGVPRRVMFYNLGDWVEFPYSVVKILIDGFMKEKSSIRFSIGYEPLLLDFLSMVVINLRTRKQRSVAWIDESEKCFFPTIFGHDDDGSSEWDFESLGNRSVQTEVERGCVSPPEVIKHVIGERAAPSPRPPPTASDALRQKLETLQRGSEGFLSVQNQFLSGMGPFARPGSIFFIHRYLPKDNSGQKRKEIFERLIKHTKEVRGNANVNYAWFGAKKIDTVGALIHGFGSFGKPTEGVLGTGLYLTPEGRSFASVNACDVDEKGMQYMILCRVILGNLEQVHPGSKQYYPSSGDYDSGVDNLFDPKCYVVWPTHVSTYIYPEYLVSFKLAPNVQEYLSGLKDIRYHVTPTPASVTATLNSGVMVPMNPPTTPWVPFTLLIEAVRPNVPPLTVELLVRHHQELKNKVIDRDELIKKTRLLIGDQLLISVLNRFKRDPSSWHVGPPAKKMKLEESPAPQLNKNNPVNPENDGSTQPHQGPNSTM